MSASDSRSVTVLPGSSQESPHGKGTVLPPLTSQYPQWSRAGKLGLGIYQRPFSSGNENKALQRCSKDGKVNKKGPELAAIGRSEGLMVTPMADPLLRVAQLEQNIRFLQEQHQIMLASLHQEVEQLRHRNRDLQFQLVFTKGGVALVQSSPSSPEDDSKPKIILSPKQVNMTPLQVELLEKEVIELKGALSEAKTKNTYLSGIVDEQKKKLDSLERGKRELEAIGSKITPSTKSDAQNQAGSSSKTATLAGGADPDLAFKLEEAEKVIRRLRRDNDEHRRELVTIKSNLSKSLGGTGGNRQLGGGGGGSNGHRGSVGAAGGNGHHRPHNQQQSQSQRFPPLHSQSYWHHGQHSQQHRTGMEFVSHRHCANGGGGGGGGGGGNGGGRLEKEAQVVGRPAPSLPNLRNNSTSSGYAFSNGNNNGNSHRRGGGGGHYNGNGNHYYRGGNKGGGGRGNRESRDRGDAK